jgi:hypothetical protein
MTNSFDIVVNHAPKKYPHQEGLTCGETNVRGILDGFRIPYEPLDKPPFRVKLFGFAFVKDISSLIQKHGLVAPLLFASKFTNKDRVNTFMKHIDRDEPVIIAIGNGHLSRTTYSPIARIIIGHFITIYGYNAKQEIFYVYDPYLKGNYHKGIPVGNEVRTFRELLRDWNGPFYYRFINMNHVYIPISCK